MDPFRQIYLSDALERFRSIKTLADRALAQLEPGDWRRRLDPDANSIAELVKHMAGNMRSRWTDFLDSDGEKPDRHRDREFELTAEDTPEALLAAWERGWQALFAAIGGLQPEDLERTVVIRAEPHTIPQAISRQVGHLAGHANQIVLLARHFRGEKWETLSIPRGGTEAFNRKMKKKGS